jgi:hypothetical protein
LEKFNDAIKHYNKAIEIDSNYIGALNGNGAALGSLR